MSHNDRAVAGSALAAWQQYVLARGALEANGKFYAAFRATDILSMAQLWLPDEDWGVSDPHDRGATQPWHHSVTERMGGGRFPLRACCRHPGRRPMYGHDVIIISWNNIFEAERRAHRHHPPNDIRPTHVRGRISPCGQHAELFALEVLRGGRIPATNHFAFVADGDVHNGARAEAATARRWRMIVHKAEPTALEDAQMMSAQMMESHSGDVVDMLWSEFAGSGVGGSALFT